MAVSSPCRPAFLKILFILKFDLTVQYCVTEAEVSNRLSMRRKIAFVVRGLFELSDSIGFDCVSEYKMLRRSAESDTEIRIFAEKINANNYPDIPVEHISRLKPWVETSADSTVIYHWCDGWPYFDALFLALPSRLIVRWHNNTPPWFYAEYSMHPITASIRGFESLLHIARTARVAFWVNSVFTARQLAFLGVETDRIHVVYPISPFIVSTHISSPAVDRKQVTPEDGQVRLLFVGRAVPHKGHKHLVAIAAMVQELLHKNVRLTMVGRLDGNTSRFVDETKKLAQSLKVEAIFTGELPLAALDKIYGQSHVFLCFSEHEGFGLPVFEAMRVGIPVVGLRSTAVGEFLRFHPLAVSSVDYEAAAIRVIAALQPKIRDEIAEWQQENVLSKYSEEIVQEQMSMAMTKVSEWPDFGGVAHPAIEAEVSRLELKYGPQLKQFASRFPALGAIPRDTIDRFVTRYDISSFKVIAQESQLKLTDPDLLNIALSTHNIANRPVVGTIVRLARRSAVSLQLGLIRAIQSLSNNTNSQFRQIEEELEQIRSSIQSLRSHMTQDGGQAPFKSGTTFSDFASVFGQHYFVGGDERSAYRNYARDARQPNRELATTLFQVFHPRTALEVGCAIGHAVEALRELDVEAFGYDISSWAVEQASTQYVRRFDIASEPIHGSYELVFAYDLLQFIPISQLKFAVENLWNACTKSMVLAIGLNADGGSTTCEPAHLIQQDRRWWETFLQEECGIVLDSLAISMLDGAEHSQRFNYKGRIFVAQKRAYKRLESAA